VELGYARESTAKQDLERQIDALTVVGIAPERIYLDKKSGATADRPGLRAVLGLAQRGDVIVVHTLDRLGRTVRDTLNLIHELTERGWGCATWPTRSRSTRPTRPTRWGNWWCCWRCSPRWNGRQVGRPSLLDPAVLACAAHLRDAGHSMAQIVAETGMTRSSLYRYLPPRPAAAVTAAERAEGVTVVVPVVTAGASVVGA